MKRKAFALVIALVLVECCLAVDYDGSKAKIEESIKSEIAKGLREGNEPFFIDKGNNLVGILLIHGFTASPWEVRELGEYLSQDNISVYGPLLAGHGTSAEDLKKTTWKEWYKKVNDSYTMMQEGVECVYVGGMSTGSSLALMLAAEHQVCGVIAIGTPVFFQDWKIRFAGLAKYVIPYTTRQLSPEVKPYYYEKRPTAAVAELYRMTGIMKKSLPDVGEPIIIIQSLADKTVKPESADYVMGNVGSRKKVFIWFEEGEHVIIKDEQREEVFKLIREFIRDDTESRLG